jgi:hypothetical protein
MGPIRLLETPFGARLIMAASFALALAIVLGLFSG